MRDLSHLCERIWKFHGTALCTIQMLSIANYKLWTVEQLQRPVARDNLLIVSKPKPKPRAPSNDQHRPRWSLIWLRRLPANPRRSHPAPPPLVISAPRETGPQSFWPLMGPHHLLRLGLLGPGSWGQATSPLFVQEFKLVLTDNLIAGDVSMLCVCVCVQCVLEDEQGGNVPMSSRWCLVVRLLSRDTCVAQAHLDGRHITSYQASWKRWQWY